MNYGKETWMQDSTDRNFWHAKNGLMVNAAALKEREGFYEIERVYAEDGETWTQDDLDSDLWHNSSGLMLNSAALNEREQFFVVERVYAIEPYLNMRDYDCASC